MDMRLLKPRQQMVSTQNCPSPYTRAVVWGGRPDTVQSASTWLLKKGILVVDQTKVLQAAADQKVSLTGYQYLETDVLRMAKLVGARLVVFSNAEVQSWEALDWSAVFPRSQRLYSATIAPPGRRRQYR